MDEKKTLRVLIKEPDKAPYVKEIEDTLEAKQEIVGGLIECVEMPDMRNVDLFVNEEGKLDNLKGNFWLPEYEDCVVGTCFMVGYNPEECDNVSITDEQVEQCKKYIENYVIPKGMDLYLDFNILEPYMKNQFKKVKKQKMEM
ncbi:MAG: DUF3846 domain-containing protein [Clostridiales bacterium]|nr:DUF3846 domain-containing protein [Clostridiales bacterium]